MTSPELADNFPGLTTPILVWPKKLTRRDEDPEFTRRRTQTLPREARAADGRQRGGQRRAGGLFVARGALWVGSTRTRCAPAPRRASGLLCVPLTVVGTVSGGVVLDLVQADPTTPAAVGVRGHDGRRPRAVGRNGGAHWRPGIGHPHRALGRLRDGGQIDAAPRFVGGYGAPSGGCGHRDEGACCPVAGEAVGRRGGRWRATTDACVCKAKVEIAGDTARL